MHELALAQSLREIVDAAAAEHGARRVSAVRLRVGRFAAVEVEALRFCFDVAMAGGPAAAARLEIESAPGSGWCWDCSAVVELDAVGLPCPRCAGRRVEVTAGTEMRVTEIEFETTAAGRGAEEAASCA